MHLLQGPERSTLIRQRREGLMKRNLPEVAWIVVLVILGAVLTLTGFQAWADGGLSIVIMWGSAGALLGLGLALLLRR
jgi:hypothetical protein